MAILHASMLPSWFLIRDVTLCKAFAMCNTPLPMLLLLRSNSFNPWLSNIIRDKYSLASSDSWLLCKSSTFSDERLQIAFRISTAADCKLLPTTNNVCRDLLHLMANARSLDASLGILVHLNPKACSELILCAIFDHTISLWHKWLTSN